eukprot:3913754-Prymnesium_polylepis.1
MAALLSSCHHRLRACGVDTTSPPADRRVVCRQSAARHAGWNGSTQWHGAERRLKNRSAVCSRNEAAVGVATGNERAVASLVQSASAVETAQKVIPERLDSAPLRDGASGDGRVPTPLKAWPQLTAMIHVGRGVPRRVGGEGAE